MTLSDLFVFVGMIALVALLAVVYVAAFGLAGFLLANVLNDLLKTPVDPWLLAALGACYAFLRF